MRHRSLFVHNLIWSTQPSSGITCAWSRSLHTVNQGVFHALRDSEGPGHVPVGHRGSLPGAQQWAATRRDTTSVVRSRLFKTSSVGYEGLTETKIVELSVQTLSERAGGWHRSAATWSCCVKHLIHPAYTCTGSEWDGNEGICCSHGEASKKERRRGCRVLRRLNTPLKKSIQCLWKQHCIFLDKAV